MVPSKYNQNIKSSFIKLFQVPYISRKKKICNLNMNRKIKIKIKFWKSQSFVAFFNKISEKKARRLNAHQLIYIDTYFHISIHVALTLK